MAWTGGNVKSPGEASPVPRVTGRSAAGTRAPKPLRTTPMPHDAQPPVPLLSRKAQGLKGRIKVPGDKSMSHRALMLGAVANGETTVDGLLEAEDVINTAKAMAALG